LSGGRHGNHPEEAILLLAHSDRIYYGKAMDGVRIEYEPQAPVSSIEEVSGKNGYLGVRTMFSRRS